MDKAGSFEKVPVPHNKRIQAGILPLMRGARSLFILAIVFKAWET